jgi:hypothetical protein
MGVLASLFTTKLGVESEAELIDRSKIEAHIGVIKGYFDHLSRLKYPFSADLQPLILLSTLPDDPYWTGIRGNIVSSLGTGMTWDKVRARLLTLGKHLEPADESAMAAKSQSSNTAKPPSSSGDKHCLFHGQNKSHTTEQCFHCLKLYFVLHHRLLEIIKERVHCICLCLAQPPDSITLAFLHHRRVH